MPYGTDFPEFLSLTGGGFEWDGEVNEDGKGDSERESERERVYPELPFLGIQGVAPATSSSS
jgi:hypothetical protein